MGDYAFKILPRCRQKLYGSGMTKLLEQARRDGA
jgi:hypothetical protein